jgi:signal transduction histidine kinase
MIVTQIKDEGQGIPEDELESIFSAYQTTTVKSTNHEKSTGIGLAIVKKIIDAHEGLISVDSKPGIGTEFAFFLPLK